MKKTEKKERRGVNKYIPIAFWAFLGLAALSLIILFIMKGNSSFAEFFNRTTGRVVRFVLTSIFNIFPFSFLEMFVLAIPVLIVVLVIAVSKLGKRGVQYLTRFFCIFLCVIFSIFSVFVLGYEASYYGATIEQNTGVDRNDLSVEELKAAAIILHDRAAAELDNVQFLDDGQSVMPYTFYEMSDKVNEAYLKFNEKYPAYQKLYSRLKPVLLSEPWTYTHTSGLYSFFTGEANINVNYPDFIVVSTAAHEMSHQRGIGKEDEADFASFLVCIGSDDPYIRYCGYIELYRNVIGRLSGADKDAWLEVRQIEDKRIRGEINAFSTFFDKYRENVAATVSNAVNNAYIQMHNQPAGIKSYGLVVDLVVNYLLYSEQ